MKTRGGILLEDRERDLHWQQPGEDFFSSLFVSTSAPSHLSHTDILAIFHHGKSVQHTFCTAQPSVTGQSVLAVFVEMLFSLFLFSCVGIWNQEGTFHMCLTDRRWCVNREKWREPPMLSISEPFLSHLQMFAKEVFWFNCSLLDYVIMAFEFFIRSFLSWSLGLRGTCFLAFDVFGKVRLFVSLLLCFDSLTPSLGSILMCRAQLCASAAWDVFVVYFCTGHKSLLLLPSLHIVIKAGYCWPVHLENLCLLTAVQEIQYFNERHATFAWRDGWHYSNCTFSPQALSPGKKILSL